MSVVIVRVESDRAGNVKSRRIIRIAQPDPHYDEVLAQMILERMRRDGVIPVPDNTSPRIA